MFGSYSESMRYDILGFDWRGISVSVTPSYFQCYFVIIFDENEIIVKSTKCLNSNSCNKTFTN